MKITISSIKFRNLLQCREHQEYEGPLPWNWRWLLRVCLSEVRSTLDFDVKIHAGWWQQHMLNEVHKQNIVVLLIKPYRSASVVHNRVRTLCGLLTDGDIRPAILQGRSTTFLETIARPNAYRGAPVPFRGGFAATNEPTWHQSSAGGGWRKPRGRSFCCAATL